MRVRSLVVALVFISGVVAVAAASNAATAPEFNFIGRYTTGLGEAGGEIVAYEKNRIYVSNAGDKSIDIVNIANPAAPALIERVAMDEFGDVVNSVAVSHGKVAVAVQASPKTDPGKIVLLTKDGDLIGSAVAGAQPDMVKFTPTGDRVLAANEGEPNDSYSIDPVGSISIIKTADFALDVPPVTTVSFADFNTGGPRNSEVSPQIRIYGPGASVAQDLEPEFITVSKDGKRAWVSLQENNAIARIKMGTGTVEALLPLGYKNHNAAGNGLDPTDTGGVIGIGNWPVFGMYQPDAIAVMETEAGRFLFTANEGDARDWNPGLQEEARVSTLALDPVAFPTAATLQQNGNMGRLTVTTKKGNTDADPEFEELYALGGRSFSVFDATTGALVFDSGDDFEQTVATKHAAFFNSDHTADNLDNRSDNKGPEPEGLALGKVGKKTFAFIGCERDGGVFMYDVTNPTAPVFADYFTSRTFDGAPIGPDSGPEAVVFIPAGKSPTDKPVLLVSNEITGTVAIFGTSTPN